MVTPRSPIAAVSGGWGKEMGYQKEIWKAVRFSYVRSFAPSTRIFGKINHIPRNQQNASRRSNDMECVNCIVRNGMFEGSQN